MAWMIILTIILVVVGLTTALLPRFAVRLPKAAPLVVTIAQIALLVLVGISLLVYSFGDYRFWWSGLLAVVAVIIIFEAHNVGWNKILKAVVVATLVALVLIKLVPVISYMNAAPPTASATPSPAPAVGLRLTDPDGNLLQLWDTAARAQMPGNPHFQFSTPAPQFTWQPSLEISNGEPVDLYVNGTYQGQVQGTFSLDLTEGASYLLEFRTTSGSWWYLVNAFPD